MTFTDRVERHVDVAETEISCCLDVPGLEGPGSQDECTKLQACLDNGPCRFRFGMHGQSS